jgi:hypothetical protein
MKQKTTIHIHRSPEPFAIVPKRALNDATLSWKAKGILAYLIGKPNNWKVRISDIVNRGSDRFTSVKSGLNELRESGYACLECIRVAGIIREWCWHVANRPQFKKVNKSSPPEAENPLVVNQLVENPLVENRMLPIKSVTKTEKEKKKNTTNKAADAAGGADGGHSLSGADAPEEKELNDGTCFMTRWSQCFQQWFGAPYLQKPGEAVQANKLIKTLDCRPKDLLAYALRMWINTSEADFVNAGQYDPLFYQIKGSRSARFFLNNLSDIAEEQEHPLDCALRVTEPDFQELEALVKVGRPEAC